MSWKRLATFLKRPAAPGNYLQPPKNDFQLDGNDLQHPGNDLQLLGNNMQPPGK